MSKSKIFLGGTWNNSTWREKLIPMIKADYFNPVVKNWTEAYQKMEEEEKTIYCDVHLYVITKEMKGVFSIAEAIDSCYQDGKMTILHVIPDGFDEAQLKSLKAVVNLVNENGMLAYVESSIEKLAFLLNVICPY